MTRVLSALVLLPIVFGLIWGVPPVGTLALCLVVIVLSCLEYERMTARAGHRPMPWLATGLTLVAYLAITVGPDRSLPFLLAPAVMGTLLVLRAGTGSPRGLLDAAATAFPVLYLAYPVAAIVIIRTEFGPWPLVALIGTQVVSDSAQYYAGRLLGRTPLAPAVSPKKTWEGAAGGLVAATVALPAFGHYWMPGLLSVGTLAGLGLLVAVAGIFGDLFESLIKRSVDMKDASGLIPGHGGVLDRIDALLFSTPVFYVALVLLTRGMAP